MAPHCAGTSRICGKIKKSNVLHYICHFTSDKNIFLYSWLFFSLTWAENEHWQPLVALRPLEAVKSFISCPCDTGKQPLIPKIVSDTGKMTNEWSKVLLSLTSPAPTQICKKKLTFELFIPFVVKKNNINNSIYRFVSDSFNFFPLTDFKFWSPFVLGHEKNMNKNNWKNFLAFVNKTFKIYIFNG